MGESASAPLLAGLVSTASPRNDINDDLPEKLSVTLLLILLMTAPPQAKANDAKKPDAEICRSYPVTGNRAKRERTCRKRADWRAVDDEQRRVGTEAVERSRRATINPY